MLYLCHEVSIGYVVHVVAYSCAYGEYSDDFLYHWQEQDPKNRVLYFVQTEEEAIEMIDCIHVESDKAYGNYYKD
jgi:hypothetical protein